MPGAERVRCSKHFHDPHNLSILKYKTVQIDNGGDH